MKQRDPVRHGWWLLAALLWYGILTLWITDRRALGIYQVAALGGCTVWAIYLVFHPVTVKWSILLIPVALVPIWGLAQLAAGWTINQWETWNSVLNWTVDFAIFFLAIQLLSEPKRRRRFLQWLLYFGVGLSILATVQMFTSEGKFFWLFPSGYSDFVLGPFVYRNQYAAFIETVLPLALYQGVVNKKPFPYWVMAGVMVASVLTSSSRTGTLLVLVEVIMIPLLAVARGFLSMRTAAVALCSGVALSAVFTVVVGWDVIWSRFQQADPYAMRREMLQSSVQMIHDRPIMGFGLGVWPTAYPAYALFDDGSFANQAHNDWAQWAVEGGLPLAAVMAVFGLLLARAAWGSLWGFGLMALLLHGFVDYPLQQRPALAGWFFAMAGALVAARAIKKIPVIGQPDGESR